MYNDGGIFSHRFSSGVTLSGNASTGLACSEIDFLDAKANTVVIGLQDNGNLESVDRGVIWKFLGGSDGADAEIFEPFNGDIFVNNGVYASPPAWQNRQTFGVSMGEMAMNSLTTLPPICLDSTIPSTPD